MSLIVIDHLPRFWDLLSKCENDSHCYKFVNGLTPDIKKEVYLHVLETIEEAYYTTLEIE